ncbi:MAG: radical SAM protein [Planctomycetes bacterium]|nr:radical SAM protein [Planctomycetota bacterium]
MTLRQSFRRIVGDRARGSRLAYGALKSLENRVELYRHAAASIVPALIKPRPYKIMIAVTAACNARCQGCRYERDFMVGEQLPYEMVDGVLTDAAEAGFYSIRFYGGEPLLHPDLPRMVERCETLGMRPYVTTNAALLDKKIDALVAAGLRDVTVGFYGVGAAYDEYTQRRGLFASVERGIAATRERHGDRVQMQMNWLLMRPSANVRALHDAVQFAEKYAMTMRIDLVHYSLPYFQEGNDRCLQFGPEHRGQVERIVAELVALKRAKPHLLEHTVEGLRSITDWLLLGPEMKVPCTAYEMIWVGADGTVQMCYVTFKLGSLKEKRFRDLLFTEEHRCAARDAFKLACPNCHCSSNERVMRHAPSRRLYGREGAPALGADAALADGGA